MQLQNGAAYGRAELRNFLTLSRVVLGSSYMGAENICDIMLLPCWLSLGR